MSETGSAPSAGRTLIGELLREEARLLPRLADVLRFRGAIYREIEEDPNAIPGAFAVVLMSSLLAGLGQATIAGLFLGVAGALTVWALSSGLVWLSATLILGRRPDYARLLRALGFAYAWNGLGILGFLPYVGTFIEWAAFLLWGASLVLATEPAVGCTRRQAMGITVLALSIPVAVLLGLFR